MAEEPVIIKKYANRRLYNTETSAYVTLDDLSEMVRDGRDFEVVDAKSGEDITRSVLAQIIFEAETRDGAALMPVGFMRQLIRFYDHSLQSVVPHYLELSMQVFSENQEALRDNARQMFGGTNPFMDSMEEIQRRNMELVQQTFTLFNPFLAPNAEDRQRRIDKLSKQVGELNGEIERLKKQA